MASLVTTPREVVEYALAYCHPHDVHSFALTCRFACYVVYGPASSYLWQHLYLRYPFDDPRRSLRARHEPSFISRFDWKCELQRRIRSSKPTIFNTNGELVESPRALKDKLATYISVVRAASPVAKDGRNEPSHDLQWLEEILPTLDSWRINSSCVDKDLQQLLAELRSCFGLSLSRHLLPFPFLKTLRTQGRCYVYGFQNYRNENERGPFLCGGQVNWIHVEAIMIVILGNLVGAPLRPLTPPLGLCASRAYSAPGVLANDKPDWAGVQGTWARYLSFMDYRLLHELNYSGANGHSLQSFFDNLPEAEATRLFRLDLRLVRCYGASTVTEDTPYPPLRFIGTLKGIVSSPASLEGTVRMEADGVVRWQFTSSFDNVTAWCSEGIQLGNVASGLGVVGIWSGNRHVPGEPVGPFWMWRVRSEEFSNVH